MKIVPLTIGPNTGRGDPFLNSCTSTINKNISESSIDELNFNAHVKVMSDPIIWMKSALLLVSTIEDGGTV